MIPADKKSFVWMAGGVVVGVLVVGFAWVLAEGNQNARGLGEGAMRGQYGNGQLQAQGERGNGYGSEQRKMNNREDGRGQGQKTCGMKGEKGSYGCDGSCSITQSQSAVNSVGQLDEEAKQALDEALADEYKARATYEKVIEKFGAIRPFSMIIRAEEQHINSLKRMYEQYGIQAPDAQDVVVPDFSSVSDACSAGVEAEIANAKLYSEKLLPAVAEYEDVTAVFTNLMDASQNNHLPAFERCR